MSAIRWFDSHAHPTRAGIDDEYEAMRAGSVEGVVAVGTTLETSIEAIEIASYLRSVDPEVVVGATVGIHPHDAEASSVAGVGEIEELIDLHPEVIVGVGECGLDYFYEHSDRRIQREVFRAQIRLARARDRTLVIHSRNAFEDTFAILEEEALPERVIMHCFVGGPAEVERSLELGAMISFSGIVTFKNATDVQAAAKLVPIGSILIETDSPYLAPVPLRGKPNQIANVAITGRFIGSLRGESVVDIADATWENTLKGFKMA
ncbi:MAG: TatD family hydrolase [Ferrimicrobium sp.]